MTKRRVASLAMTSLAIVAADQITKALVRASLGIGESRVLVPGILWLTRVHNTGAAFGMLRGQQWLLMGVAVAVLAAIVWVAARMKPRSRMAWAALAMIAAGALGNLIDRALLDGVTDFFDLGWFPVFNVADISLDVGVTLLVWWLLFSKEHGHHMTADGQAAVSGSPDDPQHAESRPGGEEPAP